MKKKVIVIMGGLSGERKISFLTGKACSEALKKKGFKVINLDAKGYFLEKIKKTNPNVIFNALHGKYGEDGFTQSILESLQIPYTHSGVLSSSLAMDKELSRIIFKNNKISVPKYFLFEKNQKKSFSKKLKETKIKFPIVVKPINEGSSIGVKVCSNIIKLNKSVKATSKAKQTVQIKSSFTIGQNPITSAGDKVVYLQVVDPSGKTLQFRTNQVFKTDNGTLPYSEKRTINYQNKSIGVAIFYDLRGKKLSKGVYKSNVYCDGNLIGTDTFTLK